MQTQNQESQNSMTPAEALKLLKEGNQRFCDSKMTGRDLRKQIDATSGGQWPFAAILSCIDSRTSSELIFDQGIGDVFNARIAGNFVNEDILGSFEFACAAAGAKLIVVVGHSACGAIKGACDHVELGNLTQLLSKIEPAVDCVCSAHDFSDKSSANAELVQLVAEENVRRAVTDITERSSVLAELKDKGAIDVVGAMYDVATGEVDFLN